MHGGVVSEEELIELRKRVEQLQGALRSRVVIEQAKGILSERFHLSVDEAFLLLRYAARSSQRMIRDVAGEVVRDPVTPQAVVVALTRESRWRAASQREYAEAQREEVDVHREKNALVRARAERLEERRQNDKP